MSGYRRVNYYELCRLCTSSEGERINIFREEGRRRSLQSKIETLLPIRVEEEDSLPKIVCHECVIKLESYIEFRDSASKAESMLEGYFTSLRFSDDFLKEGKVYVKTIDKDKIAPLTTPQTTTTTITTASSSSSQPTVHDDDHVDNNDIDEEDEVKMEIKLSDVTNEPTQIIINESHSQHQQPVLISNLNTSNIQIISGVQARVQQYKCAMQMQSGGVASVVEATAETHYSYQQQTTNNGDPLYIGKNNIQQLSPDDSSSHRRLNEPQIIQNQIQNQNQLNIQNQRQIVHQQQQQQQQQQQCTITQTQIQQLRDYEKRQLQIEKEQNHVQVGHQNNNVILKTDDENQQQQQQQTITKEEIDISSGDDNTYTTVQTNSEVFLGLAYKDNNLTSQVTRDDVKDYMKTNDNVVDDDEEEDDDDTMTRNSIGQISEFLRIRTCPDTNSLITVNPQAICQTNRNLSCRDCGKNYDTINELNNHQCPTSPMINGVNEIIKEDDVVPISNNNINNFSCDVCSKPFKRKEHLFQHRKLHTGERPYVCQTCSKAFSRKEHLVRHSVSHTGQKMHECELCGKSFSRKDNLHKHRKTHGVSGPYICETCGKSFVVKHYYMMHLTTHAPSVVDGGSVDPLPYKCDLCHKAFSVKQYLTTHKLRHRSKNSSNSLQQQQQQQQQQQSQQQQQQQPVISSSNGINITGNSIVTSSSNINVTNGQNNDSQINDIQSVIERGEQSQQHPNNFDGNQYHGNVQHFQ